MVGLPSPYALRRRPPTRPTPRTNRLPSWTSQIVLGLHAALLGLTMLPLAQCRLVRASAGRGEESWAGEDPGRIARETKLFSRCSHGYLQLFYNHFRADGRADSPLVDWRLQSEAHGSRIRIQSQMLGKYLCFNRRKRLAARYHGRSRRCLWVERLTGSGFTMLESAEWPGNFLGFNAKGRFLAPNRIVEKAPCFHFLKLSRRDHLHSPYAGLGNAAPPVPAAHLTPRPFRPPTLVQERDAHSSPEDESAFRPPKLVDEAEVGEASRRRSRFEAAVATTPRTTPTTTATTTTPSTTTTPPPTTPTTPSLTTAPSSAPPWALIRNLRARIATVAPATFVEEVIEMRLPSPRRRRIRYYGKRRRVHPRRRSEFRRG